MATQKTLDWGSYHSSSLFFCFFLFFGFVSSNLFWSWNKVLQVYIYKTWNVYHGTNVGAWLYSIFWMSIAVK
jgi:hypothetical protein